MLRRLFTSLAGLACALLVASRAEAAPSARLVYLRGPAADECPDAHAVRAAVSTRLGYDPFLPFAPATMIVELSKEGDTFRARVKLVDEAGIIRGTRELRQEGPACAEIIDALALTMSIALDPYSLARPPAPPAATPTPVEREPPREAAPPPEGPPPRPIPTARDVRPPARTASSNSLGATRDFGLRAGVGALAAIGMAPGPSVGGALFVRAKVGRVSLALEGRYDLPASTAVGDATVESSLAMASLAPCFHFGWAAACAVGSLGSIHATSRGVSNPRDDDALYIAVGARLAVDIHVAGPLSAWARVDATLPLRPYDVALDGEVVYSLPRWGGDAGAGLAVDFF